MTEIEARVADLINFSSNQKPIDFADAFKSLMGDKVGSAIEAKKAEVAQRMFSTWSPEEDSDSDDVDSDDEDADDDEDTDTEDQDDA